MFIAMDAVPELLLSTRCKPESITSPWWKMCPSRIDKTVITTLQEMEDILELHAQADPELNPRRKRKRWDVGSTVPPRWEELQEKLQHLLKSSQKSHWQDVPMPRSDPNPIPFHPNSRPYRTYIRRLCLQIAAVALPHQVGFCLSCWHGLSDPTDNNSWLSLV